jgi:hypothetical protein
MSAPVVTGITAGHQCQVHISLSHSLRETFCFRISSKAWLHDFLWPTCITFSACLPRPLSNPPSWWCHRDVLQPWTLRSCRGQLPKKFPGPTVNCVEPTVDLQSVKPLPFILFYDCKITWSILTGT